MSKSVNVESGIGPFGLLWVVFIVMKVMHLIDWSWLIVIMWPIPVALCWLTLVILMVWATSPTTFRFN